MSYTFLVTSGTLAHLFFSWFHMACLSVSVDRMAPCTTTDTVNPWLAFSRLHLMMKHNNDGGTAVSKVPTARMGSIGRRHSSSSPSHISQPLNCTSTSVSFSNSFTDLVSLDFLCQLLFGFSTESRVSGGFRFGEGMGKSRCNSAVCDFCD